MTRDESMQALDAYRDGDIEPAEAARLAQVLRERGQASAWILEDIETTGLIAQALDDTNGDAFLRGFWERVRAEEGAARFVHDFEEKRAGVPEPVSSGKLLPFPPANRFRPWWIAAAAAVALLAAGASFWLRSYIAPMARLENVQGDVVAFEEGHRRIVRSGERLSSGEGLRIAGEESAATLVFADGSRLEFGAETTVASVTDDTTRGKRVALSEGFLAAHVTRQPAGRPMILSTPQSEVVVVGTAFSLSSGTAVTYLETQSGKVRLNRKSDGRSVEVPAGFDAVIGDGESLVAQPFVARSGKPAQQWQGYWTGAISPKDGSLALTTWLKGDLEIWNAGQRQTAFRAHGKRVTSVAFAPDGQSFATGSLDGTVKGWEPRASSLEATVLGPGFGTVNDLVYSANGQSLAVLSYDERNEKRALSSWDLKTNAPRWTPRQFVADRWVFSPRGRLFASASRQDKSITIWDLDRGEVRATLTEHGAESAGTLRNVFSMAFSHDERTLAVDGSSGLVTLWDLGTGRIRSGLPRQGGRIFGMAFSPEDRLLASGHQDGTIRLWEVAAAKPVAVFAGQGRAHARALEFSTDGRRLLTRETQLADGGEHRDGVLLLWDLPPSNLKTTDQ